MTVREPSCINRILDALVGVLKTIDGDPDLWLTRPLTVVRFSANPLALPMPALVVRCARWGPNEPQTGSQHDARAEIEVEVYTKFGAAVDCPDRALHDVASDVISAVERSWQLPAAEVASLQIHVIEGYEPVRTMDSVAGTVQTVVRFVALWPWTASTP